MTDETDYQTISDDLSAYVNELAMLATEVENKSFKRQLLRQVEELAGSAEYAEQEATK